MLIGYISITVIFSERISTSKTPMYVDDNYQVTYIHGYAFITIDGVDTIDTTKPLHVFAYRAIVLDESYLCACAMQATDQIGSKKSEISRPSQEIRSK